eukprot:1313652-Lingulodinium_polyedra.AAC.1
MEASGFGWPASGWHVEAVLPRAEELAAELLGGASASGRRLAMALAGRAAEALLLVDESGTARSGWQLAPRRRRPA